jgi:hypothetical protein
VALTAADVRKYLGLHKTATALFDACGVPRDGALTAAQVETLLQEHRRAEGDKLTAEPEAVEHGRELGRLNAEARAERVIPTPHKPLSSPSE